MQCNSLLTGMGTFGATLLVIVALAPLSAATPHYRVLYAFTGTPDGVGPYSSVVSDEKGNLYGTTIHGGVYSYGTVFKLKPQPDGYWTEE